MRFLFIDDNIYHFGASLKDLGKKGFITIYCNAQKFINFCCGFSKLDNGVFDLLNNINI